MTSARIIKINSLIQKNISLILNKNLSLKAGVFITVSKVDTSPDLRYTNVFISVFPEKETAYTQETLRKEVYRIQGDLNKILHMKPLPKIRFVIDTTEIKADEIEKIFKTIEKENKEPYHND